MRESICLQARSLEQVNLQKPPMHFFGAGPSPQSMSALQFDAGRVSTVQDPLEQYSPVAHAVSSAHEAPGAPLGAQTPFSQTVPDAHASDSSHGARQAPSAQMRPSPHSLE